MVEALRDRWSLDGTSLAVGDQPVLLERSRYLDERPGSGRFRQSSPRGVRQSFLHLDTVVVEMQRGLEFLADSQTRGSLIRCGQSAVGRRTHGHADERTESLGIRIYFIAAGSMLWDY
jgi:hypothetical protein